MAQYSTTLDMHRVLETRGETRTHGHKLRILVFFFAVAETGVGKLYTWTR